MYDEVYCIMGNGQVEPHPAREQKNYKNDFTENITFSLFWKGG